MPAQNIPGDRKPSLGRCVKCNICTFHFLLHHVSLGKRLCTNCVLRENKASFCPGCFAFYDGGDQPHPSKRISCTQCPSVTHIHCAGISPPHAPYLCPPCKNASSTYLSPPVLEIKERQAAMLLCAAKIVASLMSEAAASARKSADAKVGEALCARKRAREALDHLFVVTNEEKIRKKEEQEEGDFVKDLENFLIREDNDIDMDLSIKEETKTGNLIKKEETERGNLIKREGNGIGLIIKEEKDVIKKEVIYVAL